MQDKPSKSFTVATAYTIIEFITKQRSTLTVDDESKKAKKNRTHENPLPSLAPVAFRTLCKLYTAYSLLLELFPDS